MVWRDPDLALEPETEATWEEYSNFEKESFREFTFSEIDQLEKASVYFVEQHVPPYGAIDRDFVPLNFLSSLFLHSHKGNKLYTFSRVVHAIAGKIENVREHDETGKNLSLALVEETLCTNGHKLFFLAERETSMKIPEIWSRKFMARTQRENEIKLSAY